MKLLLDSFWRAVAQLLHPRLMALSLAPLAIMAVLSFALGYFFWDAGLAAMRGWLDASSIVRALLGGLDRIGAGGLRQVLPSLMLVLAVSPLIVLGALLLVSLLLTPAVLEHVAQRRFPQLARRGNGSVAASVAWSLSQTALALLALTASIPLWFVPPLIVIVPPLIWGWLTYRIMSFDALSEHATAEERRLLIRRHRLPLLAIGLACGAMGAAPSVVWASFALFAVAFAVLLPVAIWIYTMVFVFSSLWFTHYSLAALTEMRASAPSGHSVRPVNPPA